MEAAFIQEKKTAMVQIRAETADSSGTGGYKPTPRSLN
jgi:hypothetical protein